MDKKWRTSVDERGPMPRKPGHDRGIDYAGCDTDAMIFARPGNMKRDDFQRAVCDIAEAFNDMSPYRGGMPFLKIQDQCFSLHHPERIEPLFFLALGTKKYDEYNLNRQGTPIIRHVAAIGLGDLREPAGYSPDAHEFTSGPHPEGCGDDICHATAAPLIMDLLRHVIRRFEMGEQRMIERDFAKLPALKTPAYAEIQITYPFDMVIYKNVPGCRPFMPLLRIPGKGDNDSFVVTGPPAADGCFDYPADREYVIERDSGEKPSKAQFETLLPRLQDYFQAQEPKVRQRRDVSIGEQFVIPKETRAIKPDAIGNEIEPELRRAELATLFRIDGDKFVPAGRARKETAPSGPFAALERTGLLRRFVSSIDIWQFRESWLATCPQRTPSSRACAQH